MKRRSFKRVLKIDCILLALAAALLLPPFKLLGHDQARDLRLIQNKFQVVCWDVLNGNFIVFSKFVGPRSTTRLLSFALQHLGYE